MGITTCIGAERVDDLNQKEAEILGLGKQIDGEDKECSLPRFADEFLASGKVIA